MIESLILENFQRHAYLKIDFDKITTIIGTSDVGKSAIVRALYWIVANRPLGCDFMKHGSSGVSAAVTVDGNRIIRFRDNRDENSYIVNGETLDKVGDSVPDKVSSLLRMEKINFQHQHDSPLWFEESAGYVAQQLNKVIDLDTIDNSRTFIATRQKELKSEIKKTEEELQLAESRLAAMEFLYDMYEELITLEAAEYMLGKLKSDVTAMRPLVEEGRTLQRRIIEIPDTTALEIAAANLESINSDIRRLGLHIEIGRQLKSRVRDIPDTGELASSAADLVHMETMLRSLRPLVNSGMKLKSRVVEVPNTDLLDTASAELNDLANEISALRRIVKEIANAAARRVKAEEDHKKAEQEFKTIMGDVCPLCGSKLS